MGAYMFEAAIEELEKAGKLIGTPQSFQHYIKSNSLPKASTAPSISIDDFNSLNPALKSRGYMVFRLGSKEGGDSTTQFALAKFDRMSDFFLFDKEIFANIEIQPFIPNVSVRSLFSYQLIPQLTETSLVNLAFASGLIQSALKIETNKEPIIPATGQSTFTFNVRPLTIAPDSWRHYKGQVEIDGLFIGMRDGREHIFVVEAKSNNSQSIAKHKLVYPLLAIAQSVPSYMSIVPLFIRTIRTDRTSIIFKIAECQIDDPRIENPSVESLRVKKTAAFSLFGY